MLHMFSLRPTEKYSTMYCDLEEICCWELKFYPGTSLPFPQKLQMQNKILLLWSVNYLFPWWRCCVTSMDRVLTCLSCFLLLDLFHVWLNMWLHKWPNAQAGYTLFYFPCEVVHRFTDFEHCREVKTMPKKALFGVRPYIWRGLYMIQQGLWNSPSKAAYTWYAICSLRTAR